MYRDPERNRHVAMLLPRIGMAGSTTLVCACIQNSIHFNALSTGASYSKLQRDTVLYSLYFLDLYDGCAWRLRWPSVPEIIGGATARPVGSR